MIINNRLLNDQRGDAMIEWLILAALVVAVLGSTLLSVFESLKTKLTEINDGL